MREFSRRTFIRQMALGTAGAFLLPQSVLAAGEKRLVILHTNDTHSRIDPFPMDGGRNEGLGGVARRKTLIDRIRAEHRNVLLLDSGDIFQGTPYFNFFKGEVEFKAMSDMGYDVATLGNHDFDNGVQGLVDMLPHADFQWVSANYDVAGSLLEPHVRPSIIMERGGIRIGIFGLGIDFDGLVLDALHDGVSYMDPVVTARRQADALREAGCGLVVCLSHLGHRYRGEDRPDDVSLAAEVPEIDVILGGHTHTFLDEPVTFERVGRPPALVNQVGFAGIRLGRLDFIFDGRGRLQRWYAGAYEVSG
jgi:5'-nucleotidase